MTSRCSRELFLLDAPPPEFGGDDRGVDELAAGHKRLLLDRLERLTRAFSIEVIGFSVMGNHLHLILRSVPEEGFAWSAGEVVRRWLALHPPRDRHGPIDSDPADLAVLVADDAYVSATRRKLMDLSQFMKDLKQHVAEEANRLDASRGPFWAGRFKSKPITDHERGQLVKAMIYVDLNPLAAGLCSTPEEGRFTSLEGRLAQVSPSPPDAFGGVAAPWLVDMDGAAEEDEASTGRGRIVLPGLTLGLYLRLLDAASRVFREGKVSLDHGAASLFDRLDLVPEDLLAGLPRFASGSPHT